MSNILVFCAGNSKARANYNASILTPVPVDTVLSSFHAERHQHLREIQDRGGGFFAWGLGATRRASYFWERLTAGDVVLGFFEFHYRVVARLIGKEESAALAERLWGSGDWSRILFLTKPDLVAINARDVCPPLCSTYRGTTRISDGRIAAIVSEYGSISTFLERKFGVKLEDARAPRRELGGGDE
jgi:hypothetical protein